jgi:hypothetical protein
MGTNASSGSVVDHANPEGATQIELLPVFAERRDVRRTEKPLLSNILASSFICRGLSFGSNR